MAVGFDHPKSKTHVGDGFKFLEEYKNTFDVIITDSSDPEGPAESLFQKPYFQLLHDALREGGVITTQGCTFPFVQKNTRRIKEVLGFRKQHQALNLPASSFFGLSSIHPKKFPQRAQWPLARSGLPETWIRFFFNFLSTMRVSPLSLSFTKS